MDKLELKHLAPYLPYGLKIFLVNHNYHEYPMRGDNIITIEGIIRKPILRPLSDLTKEISFNGYNFIPMMSLFSIEHPSHKYGEFYFKENYTRFTASHYSTAMEFEYYRDCNKNKYHVIQQLLEWHFDIFGLIEAGLAIDINTLN